MQSLHNKINKEHGRLDAKAFVRACGSWAVAPVRPIYTQLIVLEHVLKHSVFGWQHWSHVTFAKEDGVSKYQNRIR
jgi:hypothetical protein